MELPVPSARYLGAGDESLLGAFRCSSGIWFEEDVEVFITTRLLDQHEWRRPHTEHTIIGLELRDHGLIAVGSHEQDLVTDGRGVLHGTYLECAAVAVEFQGSHLPDLDPLDADGAAVTVGRYLIEVMLSDVSELGRVPVVRAVVARENARSLRLCARVGLRTERPDPDPRFVQLSGAFS